MKTAPIDALPFFLTNQLSQFAHLSPRTHAQQPLRLHLSVNQAESRHRLRNQKLGSSCSRWHNKILPIQYNTSTIPITSRRTSCGYSTRSEGIIVMLRFHWRCGIRSSGSLLVLTPSSPRPQELQQLMRTHPKPCSSSRHRQTHHHS